MPATGHVGRYAPSPTGDLHLGNLRTALAAWLAARSSLGSLLLRMDDLDPDRVRPESAAAQMKDLRALGIDWDGAPIWQGTRFARYDAALRRLAELGRTYPCFCSRAEVRAAASAPHGPGEEGAYPGTCARLAPAEGDRRVAAGEPHCIRVRANGATRSFVDQSLGSVSAIVDDFVVRRRDGVPAYNLATVVDDAEMGVTEVVRGADLASTTPRQLWLADTLDLPAPSFLHVSLVLGADGSRLAKRHGAVTLADLAAAGLGAVDVRDLLARSLGVEAADGAPPAALVAAFDRAAIPHADLRYEAIGDTVRLTPIS
ncbi:MAG: tRNA glutamyl-Q(34) synthetase GluQRS [Thermoleophilia bacterium]|nr:tRNA glutamyl-Q(34) synthetase GluQRS [Thermoleophilia bacterium]